MLVEQSRDAGVDGAPFGLARSALRGIGQLRAERDEAVAREPHTRVAHQHIASTSRQDQHPSPVPRFGNEPLSRRFRHGAAYGTSTCTLPRMSDPGPVALPPAVAAAIAQLCARGHETHLVGPAARALLDGEPVRDFEIATSADGRALLALFPRAVPLDPQPRRLVLPSPAGPIELVPHVFAAGICGELSHRDFTLHALALDREGRVLDPFAGNVDAGAARLRCVGRAPERIAEDPLRMLRAARLVATRGLAPTPSLVAAVRDAREQITGVAESRVRAELHALLLGPHADRGLAFLRETGLEAVLAEGVAADASAIVAKLPADLELRLAAWLRGTRAVRILRRLREPRPRTVAVERLLHLHPIDAVAQIDHEATFRRLVRRSQSLLPGLVALREAEIEVRGEGAPARERLAALERAIDRAHEPVAESAEVVLALDGRAVMEILACGPGPEVGLALRHLAKAVAADPICNTPDALRERLLAWRRAD
jgi:tRNA nucleotidyltransferase/poly(A) polymerase